MYKRKKRIKVYSILWFFVAIITFINAFFINGLGCVNTFEHICVSVVYFIFLLIPTEISATILSKKYEYGVKHREEEIKQKEYLYKQEQKDKFQ